MLGHFVSEETKRKLVLANLGRKHLQTTKDKIRNAMLGHTLSEETRENMRLAQLKRYLKLKQENKPSHIG
jgi:NUMOD3 motif